MKNEEVKEVKYVADGAEITLNEETVRNYLVKGKGKAAPKDLHNFMMLCKYRGLNPYLNDVYLIVQAEDANSFGSATIVVGKDFLLTRAQAHPSYDGMECGVVISREGSDTLDYRPGGVKANGETLAGGWARVFRKDWDKPAFAAVNFVEYAKPGKNRRSNWDVMPATMIVKVAVAQALRLAFTSELRGMYISEELTNSVTNANIADPVTAPGQTVTAPGQTVTSPPQAPPETPAGKSAHAPITQPVQKPVQKPVQTPPPATKQPAPERPAVPENTIAAGPPPVTFRLGGATGEYRGCAFRIAMINSDSGQQVGIIGVRPNQPFAEEFSSFANPQIELTGDLRPLSEEAKSQIALDGELGKPQYSGYEKFWLLSAPIPSKRGRPKC